MKTKFDLETMEGLNTIESGAIQIMGKLPECSVYVAIEIEGVKYHFIKDKDLERFAVNILKALKSKHLNVLRKLQ